MNMIPNVNLASNPVRLAKNMYLCIQADFHTDNPPLTKLTTHAYQKDNHYFSGIGGSCRMRNQEILQHGED